MRLERSLLLGERLLLLALLLLVRGVAGAVELRAGSILITDRNADIGQGDARGLIALGDEGADLPLQFLASPPGFVDPQTSIALEDGRVLVVDSSADPYSTGAPTGALWTVDPQEAFPGTARLFFTSTSFVNPTDILLEAAGTVLVLDSDADPNNVGGHRGALFRVTADIPRTMSVVATSPLWVDPRSMVWDRDGAVLIWDSRADPLGLGGYPGALFRVDPANGDVQLVFSSLGFASPWAIALAPNGDYLIADRDANPGGYPGSPGAIFRVDRTTFAITPVAISPQFVDPYDLAVVPSGDIWVLDTNANPFGYPDARGAVFRCSAADGSVQSFLTSGFFRSLMGISVVPGSVLDSSRVSWDDVSGAPLQPGDRMRVHARLYNAGTIPADLVRMQHNVGAAWDYSIGSDSTGTGSFSYDPSTHIVRWIGSIPPHGEVDVSYVLRLHDTVPAGANLTEHVTLRFGRIGINFALEGSVAWRSKPGRVVWADYAPIPDGTMQGNIWEMRPGVQRPVLVFGGSPLVQPGDLTFMSDGRIAVLDRHVNLRGEGSVPGGVFAIDPFSGSVDTLIVVADHPQLQVPLGLAGGRPDELLIIDKDANPLGLPGRPGAIFGFNLVTRQLRTIASSVQFSEPSDAILESSGKIAMVDYDADPGNQNPHGGALFEVDYDTGLVRWIPVPGGTFKDPVGLAEASGRKIYVADVGADPLHSGRDTGAIFEIRRADNNSVGVASADTTYVNPTDVFPQRDGTLIITDSDANPNNYPPRDRGTIFKAFPYVGRPIVVTEDVSLFGPEAVAGFDEGDLALSHFRFTDLNGKPAIDGDTLRFEGVLKNSGSFDVRDAMATIILSPGQQLISGSGPGGVAMDPFIRAVVWSGGIPRADSVVFNGTAVVDQGHEFGDRLNGVLYVSGPGSPAPDSARIQVFAPLGSGDIVLADTNADPDQTGFPHGALFDIRNDPSKFKAVLQTDTLWTDPAAVEGLDSGRLLIADTNGSDPGVVLIADYLHGRTVPYIQDPRLGDPVDLQMTRSGDLLIVDPRAHIDNAPFRPTLFVKRAGSSSLEVLCADTVLDNPMQVTEDDQGRIWLLDRRAHPDTTVAGNGAIFQIDPLTGAMVDTLEFPALKSPMGIVSWPGEGMAVVDLPQYSGEHGRILQIDPDARTIQLRVTDPRFVLPVRAAFTSSGELWIVDRLARDETQAGSPHTLFRWDPETGVVDMIGASGDYVTPADLYVYPGPNPRLASYTVEDLNGPPLDLGDEVIVRAEVTNAGPIATLQASFVDTLPVAVSLDRTSIQADAGSVQAPGNTVFWSIDLEPGVVHNVSYHAHVRSNLSQGLTVTFRSHLRSAEGVHRIRRNRFRLPVYFEDGFIYMVDPEGDPLQLGGLHGALYKIDLNSGESTVMGSSPTLSRPIATLSLPTTEPNVLVIDRDANPLEHLGTRGCVWKWVPRTGDFTLAAADTTFRSPRAAVALNDREILLVDASAQPFGSSRHGAVYQIDVPSGSVVPLISDPMFVSPVDIVLDGRGGAFIIDADADPGHFGLRNGAIFRLDLLQRTISIYAVSADFRGPIAGTVGPNGALYVLDRDVIPVPGSEARGAIYRVDQFGNVVRDSYSPLFRSLYDLCFDSHQRLLVTDTAADPSHGGGNRGVIFRRSTTQEFTVFGGPLRYASPSGFFVEERTTPIELTDFEAAPSEEGIHLTWTVQEAHFEGFICYRAPGSDPAENEYVPLNSDAPVPGEGPWEYDDLTVSPGEVYSYRIACILSGGGERVFGPVIATAPSIKFALFPATPNPTRATATFRFDLPRRGRTILRIYDVAGRLVRTMADEPLPGGHHQVTWDGRDNQKHTSASGIYLIRIQWQDRSATRRLTLLR